MSGRTHFKTPGGAAEHLLTSAGALKWDIFVRAVRQAMGRHAAPLTDQQIERGIHEYFDAELCRAPKPQLPNAPVRRRGYSEALRMARSPDSTARRHEALDAMRREFGL